ncbi:hypothetical protein FA15DRAFT_584943, partial [Coprinopsis marcescibilis]
PQHPPTRTRFLREDPGDDSTEGSRNAQDWDEQLAAKYYDSLYREFAICDLKHFKSGNFSLRWRTEEEVLEGTGETTCANSRCEFHHGPSKYRSIETPALTTLELPFAYIEHGESKSALVKVVLCAGCVSKLMWKRRKEKEAEQASLGVTQDGESNTNSKGKGEEIASDVEDIPHTKQGSQDPRPSRSTKDTSKRHKDRRQRDASEEHGRRRRHSRSRSPRRRSTKHRE